MGLFLGMSVLSCAEIIMYAAKMTWIVISRKRRQHLVFKKEEEEVIRSSHLTYYFKCLGKKTSSAGNSCVEEG
ncbi:unnamed protein product [Gongylonema pulchrum]|uniref:Secreted protein n=1 Tax=Gongylonema pulchrum TaxID=637853 RepID=A0A183F052_9BILA|nr:unnamed protein product [Gongylonema pulchrum]